MNQQNVSETIPNIPLHIGVKDLKAVAYFTLLPPFTNWSKYYMLPVNKLRLRFKDWVELIPLGPDNEDINAISSKFYVPKGKSKVLQFQSNKVLELYLEISHETYSEVLDHLEELQNEEVHLLSITSLHIYPDTHKTLTLLLYRLEFRSNQGR